MSTQRDYYEILEIERTATGDEIKKSYKKLVLKHHPDRNPGDEAAVEKFKEAATAYDVLSDTDKRARYDRFGHAGVNGPSGGGGGGPQFHDLGDIFEQFGDIFEGMGFGGGRRREPSGPARGANLRTALTIDLRSAASGCERELGLSRHKSCATCSGSGAEAGSKASKCDYCGGKGQVVQAQGFFRIQTTCPACRGSGKVIRNKCKSCTGSGQEVEKVTLTVKVPGGIDNGMQLCLRGEGESGPNGGPRGDLYVDIQVQRHPIFEREGTHLMCRIPVSYPQAALGATIEIPLLDGQHELEVPAGTQPGEVLRLRGLGMPDPRGGRPGDLHVEIQVSVPKKLDEEHAALLRKLAELDHTHVANHEKKWTDKLKGMFGGT